MQLWLSRSSEVPVREQLTTQIMLGISSGELKPNQKLPSTRELARRFGVHSNTVNAAYRALASRGWVEFRKGSGVYVRNLTDDFRLDGKLELDQLIWEFLKIARKRGFALGKVRSRVRSWLEFQPPDHLLIIEPDAELREILLTEIHEGTGFPVSGIGLRECSKPGVLTGAAPLALYGRAEDVQEALPPNASCMMLHSSSLQENTIMLQQLPPETLIVVASRWPGFLRWARATLVATGMDPAVLSFRDARERGWQSGMGSKTFAIADVAVSKLLPTGCRVMVVRIVAESALVELRNFIQDFLSDTLQWKKY